MKCNLSISETSERSLGSPSDKYGSSEHKSGTSKHRLLGFHSFGGTSERFPASSKHRSGTSKCFSGTSKLNSEAPELCSEAQEMSSEAQELRLEAQELSLEAQELSSEAQEMSFGVPPFKISQKEAPPCLPKGKEKINNKTRPQAPFPLGRVGDGLLIPNQNGKPKLFSNHSRKSR